VYRRLIPSIPDPAVLPMQTLAADSPAVSASFLWNRKEHQRLMRQVTRHAKLPGWYRHSGVLLYTAAALSVLLPMLTGNWEGVRASLPWALVLVFWLSVFPLLTPYVAAWSYPKQHPCVSKPFHVSLTDAGVRTTCDHSDTLVKWDGVRRVVETGDFFLFYVSDRCAHYLPVRALDGPAAMERARDFILRHAPLRHADTGKR
jgi:hypothetical protein